MENFNIQEELKKLPGKPGVYLMHDEKDAIIYVGKAISLKNRVRQYFQSSRNKGAKIEQMVTHISRFEYIVTDSELEALVLECNLIKEHRPKYNTMLMDDKTYPFIKVTVNEPFPRVMMARRMKKDKAKYFGPYTSAGAVKDTIELIRKLYHIRSCNRSLPKDIGKERPCLNYHIHQCYAPCQGYISREEYRKSIDEVVRFLNGNYDPILKELEEKIDKISVYARVSPEHKIRIVKAWQKRGNIVSMTGDGVNDAPALKQADIGVAMGMTGTEVAKDAAAMVLTDDNFATIVKAVENGRNLYRNIKYAIQFLLSGNFGAILAVLYASIAGLPVPFAPVHLLFINLLTDSLPAIALGVEPHTSDVMNEKPRPADESILTKDFLSKIGLEGLVIGMMTMIGFLTGYHQDGALLGSTYAFGTLCQSFDYTVD